MAVPSPNVSQNPPANDRANAVVAGQFLGTGSSILFSPFGPFNIFLYGNGGPNGNWNASIQLERSFDGGTTWIVCGIGGAGQQAIWASAGTGSDVSVFAAEVEQGMTFRLRCTAFVSGPINYRMSASGQAALTLAVSTAI